MTTKLASSDLSFATKDDFETILGLPARTHRERMVKDQLIGQGIQILRTIIDEPQTMTIDDGPVDPNNPSGPHLSHEEPIPNPMWQRFGFESMDDTQAMLDRYEAA